MYIYSRVANLLRMRRNSHETCYVTLENLKNSQTSPSYQIDHIKSIELTLEQFLIKEHLHSVFIRATRGENGNVSAVKEDEDETGDDEYSQKSAV